MGTLIVNQYLNKDFLVDNYPGARPAYSLRELSYAKNNVVRIRRDNDNAELDFAASEITDGTLTSWVGSGNNGFVNTWYDQSGNENHAVQSDNTLQPLLVDQGSLITENNKPSLYFSGSQNLVFAPFLDTSAEMFIVTRSQYDPGLGSSSSWIKIDAYLQNNHFPWSDGVVYEGFASNVRKTLGNLSLSLSENLVLYNPRSFVGLWEAYLNNEIIYTTTSNSVNISNAIIGGGTAMHHFIPELIIYSPGNPTSRQEIIFNINNYYNIF